jgi:polar amino acid transport system substrate-binding protein
MIVGREQVRISGNRPVSLKAKDRACAAMLAGILMVFPVSAEQVAPSPAVAATGKLSVANTIDYPPFGYVGPDGEPTGIIIELAQAVAQLINVDLDLQRAPFPTLMPGLAAGRYHLAWETFSISEERLAHVSFVVFLKGGLAASTRAERVAEFAEEHSFCGKKLGASTGSASDFLIDRLTEACLAKGKPPVEKFLFSSSQDIVQAVMSGRLDVRIDDATASRYFETVSNGQLVTLPREYDVAPLGLAVPRSDIATARMMVAALSALFDNGTYGKALARYGLSDHAIAEPYLVIGLDDLRDE